MTKVKFWEHAFISLEENKDRIAIDPFLPSGSIPDSFSPTLILVTHGHGDHMGEAIALSKRSGAPIVAVFDLANYFQKRGATTIDGHVDGKIERNFGWVKMVPALHSSSGPEGEYLGHPLGFLLKFHNRLFYHAGDTALFSDMALLKREGSLFLSFLPIGGHYTMGPEEALGAVKILTPEFVIPIHYNTFPVIKQDVQAFARIVREETGSRVLPLSPGEEIEL